MPYIFEGTSIINQRKSNMDRLLLMKHDTGEKNCILVVVCDGVGSLEDGAIAAEQTVIRLREWMSSCTTDERLGLRLRDIVLEINQEIQEYALGQEIRTASTLSALLLCEDEYYLVNIGDSRVYYLEQGQLFIATSDDVSESGKLTSYMGKTGEFIPQYSEGTVGEKTFLLCSDGLYKKMDFSLMTNILGTVSKWKIKGAIKKLVQYSLKQGEKDNLTVAIVKKIH